MKSESAEELDRILAAATAAVNAQESIGRPIQSHGMDLFNHLVAELFDPRTRLEWESSSSDSSEPADHETLIEFMTKRILTLNAAKPRSAGKVLPDAPRTAKAHHAKRENETATCDLCKSKHSLWQCPAFKAKSAAERKEHVNSGRLCWNCLGRHAVAKCQSTRNCFSCGARHHTLLHDVSALPMPVEASSLTTSRRCDNSGSVLLATARVLVTDRHGEAHTVRALVDQGSEVSIVSEALVQRLRLPRSRTAVSILGIGDPSPERHGERWLSNSQVRPPAPRCPSTHQIELLLGAEVCGVILESGLRKGGPHSPLAQKTSLGWILSGCGESKALTNSRGAHQCTLDRDLNDLVQRFWLQEKEPSVLPALTPDQQRCEDFFARTHSRNSTGRYIVRLPFSAKPATLAGTRKPAERLLAAMERKSQNDPRFGSLYRTFMQEYADLHHMEKVSHTPVQQKEICFLPHHGVMKEASTSTKLRVVFNGSQRTGSGETLNGCLMIGANLLPALANVLLRWRWHRYVFMMDIAKMYRQILVHPHDRDWQRILWRPRPDGEALEYRLNTVTYGLACAPFLAIRTLRQLTDDEGGHFPLGAAALRSDSYVDDIVTGADSAEKANSTARELQDLCKAGGFPLRKWAANCQAVLAGIPVEHRLQVSSRQWNVDRHSTLGLLWHPVEDSFAISLRARTIPPLTKRNVLAETARLFNPLGWLAPVIIRAKIHIQSAWIQQVDWDSTLPAPDARLWRAFLEDLPSLEGMRVPRWLGSDIATAELEIHGFADASERAYAAVVYLRTSRPDGNTINLLAARSKVAPVKPVSLPRLELCAATLLTNLAHHVREVLCLSTAPLFLWSDSTVTLHWIRGHASRWKTSVANRVARIQDRLPGAQWLHTPGHENPADCASRGISPSEPITHPLWWSGPPWLSRTRDAWPTQKVHEEDEGTGAIPESRTVACVATHAPTEPETLLRFSSWHSLLRVTAWMLRWRYPHHPLEPDELRKASLLWIRLAQGIHYPAEIKAATRDRAVLATSPLAKLSPFLDEDSILRVGGWLRNASLPRDERHPIILPPASWLTLLMVDAHHRRSLHGGVQLTPRAAAP
ncbi:PREDICTED: uncharacterized protein LOC105556371 [Vollenhovia emeryi]|uniref:uncharacterized protein LOC105556371 n=1 Tax=Vollenhovia emeryi TaxID=411798 RepID=UPI0005F3EF89|nr:PREDICTED: uncharacterized protein LOC105556371 [Vollenhovia emeryi]